MAEVAPLGRPYWAEGAPEAPEVDRDLGFLAGDPEAVVIGAGFTGLSAALEMARRGVRVVVLEAGEPGAGASTVNGGMIGSPHGLGGPAAVARYGEALADRLFAEGREGFEWTVSLIEREGIACDFHRWGRLRLAWNRDHFKAMRTEAEMLSARGWPIEVIGREGLAQEIGSDRYVGGVLHPDHGGLNPRRFHDGLLRAALKAGARVVAGCPVEGLGRTRSGFALRTPLGRIETDAVIAATNGYTPGCLRWISDRCFPLPSFQIATAPLPEGMAARIAPGRRMMVESRRRHGYFRLSPDGTRLLYGGRASLHPIPMARAKATLRRLMAETYPELARHPVSHVWTGSLGFTFARHPHVGRREGVWFAMGYSGNGVALSPWLGRKAALGALGAPEGGTAFSETEFETRPWRGLMRAGLMPVASLMQRPIDWRENRQARRAR